MRLPCSKPSPYPHPNRAPLAPLLTKGPRLRFLHLALHTSRLDACSILGCVRHAWVRTSRLGACRRIGLITGYAVTTFLSTAAVLASDWPQIAKRAQERAEVGGCHGPMAPAEPTCDPLAAPPPSGGATEPVGASHVVNSHVLDGESRGAVTPAHAAARRRAGMGEPLLPAYREAARSSETEHWPEAD